MSDFLRLVPTDILYMPNEDERDAAIRFVKERLPKAREVSYVATEHVLFVDCGSNFEHVRCPSCSKALDGVWQDAMDAAFDGEGFGDLAWTTPCCETATSLNDLDYSSRMGFARGWLRAIDPDGVLEDEALKELESVLGCSLWVSHAKY